MKRRNQTAAAQSTAPKSKSHSAVPLRSSTVTLMFTDIEGSTLLWGQHSDSIMADVIASHNAILREAVEKCSVQELGSEGDAFAFLFRIAKEAIACALDAQLAFRAHAWPEPVGNVKIRIGINTGKLLLLDDKYQGMPANLAKRITDAGHGGQILLSAATYELVKSEFPSDSFLNLGEHRLKNLEVPERIFEFRVPDTDEFPPLRTVSTFPNNLPTPVNSFIGKETEIQEITLLFKSGQTRLVTLTGSGGIGKSRLALHVAMELLDKYRDGVWFIPLAALVQPEHILTEVATALSIPLMLPQKSEGKTSIGDDIKTLGSELNVMKQVIAYLSEKELLLVLDNFEHLIAGAMEVNTLLRECPKLHCLATSRELLQISGEQTFVVPPLSVPPSASASGNISRLPLPMKKKDSIALYEKSESVQLFLARAKAVSPNFKLTPDNAEIIAAICRSLDGLSLAIELAAARVRCMTPQHILKRLLTQLEFLSTQHHDVPTRHQTLSAVMSCSYELLNVEEQQMLARLSLFSGGFFLEAVEVICGEDADTTLALIFSLYNKSLLIQETHLERIRYRLSVPLQIYMREKQRDTREFRRAHANYYLALALKQDEKLKGAAQGGALAELAIELDNFRSALTFIMEQDEWNLFSQLAVALTQFFYIRGLWSEGITWLRKAETALRKCKQKYVRELLANVLISLAKFYNTQQNCETALQLCEEGVKIFRTAGDKPSIVKALNQLGIIARYQDAHEKSGAYFRESLHLAKALEDKWLIAYALDNLGLIAYHNHRFEEAQRLYAESLHLARELGDKRGIAYSLNNLGKTVNRQGLREEAKCYHEESLEIRRGLEDKRGIAISLNHLGFLAYRQDKYAEATDYHTESLTLQKELGDNHGIAYSLSHLGLIAYQQGHNTTAVSYYTESLRLTRELSDAAPRIPYLLDSLGKIALRQGKLAEARQYYTESLQLRQNSGQSQEIADSLYQFGRLYRAERKFSESLLLFFTAGHLYTETSTTNTLNAQAVKHAIQTLNQQLGNEIVVKYKTESEMRPLEEIVTLILSGDSLKL